MVAGYAVGLLRRSGGPAAEVAAAPDGQPFRPDEQAHAIYAPLILRYLQTLEKLGELYT